jgi:Ca-activated chloride channel homolog
MHLAAPFYLLLLLPVPFLVRRWLRRRRRAVQHPLAGVLATFPGGSARFARAVGVGLRAAALTFLILALAGPRWPDQKTQIRTEGIALMMVVDVSGSMAATDFDWEGTPISRLQAAQRVFHLFVAGGDGPGGETLPGRPTDLIGLVTFATRPEPTCPLTLSHTALLRLLGDAKPQPPPDSTTNISDAIVLGLKRLQSAGQRRKVMVVLTDGEHNRFDPPSQWTPRQAANVAAGLGVKIYTIDAGPLSATDSPGEREQAGKTLREVSQISNGEYFPAQDTTALLAACHKLDQLERAPVQSFQYRRYHEIYPILAVASLACFGLALILESTIWRRVP